jgi:hypothetical protein
VGKAHVVASHVGLREVSQDVEVKAGESVHVELTVTTVLGAIPSVSPSASASASQRPASSIH